jgi:integrase
MPKPLTPAFLRHVQLPDAGQVEHVDGACPGLRLRLSRSVATWCLNVRDADGKMRRFTVGQWPAMGLAQAREAARTMRGDVKAGRADPVKEARARRQASRDAEHGVGTLGALLDSYEAQVGSKRRSWPKGRKAIEHVFKAFIDKPRGSITASDLQLCADAHPAKQSAARAVAYLRPVLKWASGARAYVSRDLRNIEPPAKPAKRQRALSADELGRVLKALDSRASHDVMRFILMTACRLEEAGAATWGSVDWAAMTWTIAAPKNTRPDRVRPPHVVPLSRQAAALLLARKPEKAKPDALIFPSKGGKRLSNWDRVTKDVHDDSSTSGWHRHDLRRTAATMMGDLGVAPHVVEAALGHASIGGRLAATYNTSRYANEVREALQLLADRLDGIASGGAAQVVPLRRAG